MRLHLDMLARCMQPVLVRLLLVLGLVASTCSPARGQDTTPVLELVDADATYSLAGHLEVLVDREGTMSLADVQAANAPFAPAPAGIGPAVQQTATLWARFRLDLEYSEEETWYLKLPADDFTLYVERSPGQWIAQHAGYALPRKMRDVLASLEPTVELPMHPGAPQTFYLRVRQDFDSYLASNQPLVPVVQQGMAAERSERERRYAQGLFAGFMLAMIGFNLFLFISTSDRSYLYYVIFITIFLFFWTASYGYLQSLVWPDTWHRYPDLLFYVIPAGMIAYLRFTQSFLQTRTRSKHLHRLLGAYMGLSLVPALVGAVGYWVLAQQIMACLVLLIVATTLGSGLWLMRKGYRPATYFVLASALFILGTFIYTLAWFGVLPANVITKSSMQAGSSLEALLLSLGLGDRINALRRKKQDAEARRRNAETLTKAMQETSELKTQLLSIAAHDLRSPLNGIRGFAELLQSETDPTSRQYEPLGVIKDSAQHMLALVNNLLDTVAIETGNINLDVQVVSMGPVAQGVVRAYLLRAEAKRQHVRLEMDHDAPYLVDADEGRLREVMDNLVNNAVKYAPHGSQITVRLERREGKVRFSVTDEGPGLTAQDKERVFGHFQRLSAQPTGNEPSSGLGLSIAKRLIELQDGTMWVESEEGEGSVFIFEISTSATVDTPAVAAEAA